MTDGFSQSLADLSRVIERMNSTGFSEPPVVEVTGHDPDEFVRVTIGGSKVTSVDIRAAVLKRGNAEVADLVKAAINDALDKHTTAMTEALADTRTDFGALQAELNRISAESQHQMTRYLDAMDRMLRQGAQLAQRNAATPGEAQSS